MGLLAVTANNIITINKVNNIKDKLSLVFLFHMPEGQIMSAE